MSTATANTKTDITPVDDRPEQLVVIRKDSNVSFLERWIDGAEPDKALARVDAMTAMLERLRLSAIKQTYPADWVIHSTMKNGEVLQQVGYLQDSGCERAGKIFGIVIGEPTVQREDMPDGTYAYKLQAEARSQVTGETIDTAFGSRWSGDKFFTSRLGEDEKVDPTDVMKAAYANLHGRSVRALGGLSAVPLEALKAAGIDVTLCRYVGYDVGSKGGQSVGAQTGGADIVMAFGKGKGKKISELVDADLDWYIAANTRDLADPAKERFKKSTERMLTALNAEKERRAQLKAHEEATGKEAPAGDATTTRGQKVGTLNTLLADAAKEQRKVLPLLRAVTKDLFAQEIGSFQDLTEEQLDKLLGVDAKTLELTQAVLDKAAKK